MTRLSLPLLVSGLLCSKQKDSFHRPENRSPEEIARGAALGSANQYWVNRQRHVAAIVVTLSPDDSVDDVDTSADGATTDLSLRIECCMFVKVWRVMW